MKITESLIKELNLQRRQVENVIHLIDEGSTIPFIARYRKEQTGNLDDIVLRKFEERLTYLRNLEKRQEEVIKLIDDQDKLTEEIKENILNSDTLQKIEDIYRPFRPKRRTRGMIARERGLEPLSKIILENKLRENEFILELKQYIDEEKGLETEEDVLRGAKDIISEDISDEPKYRTMIKKIIWDRGLIQTEKIKDAEDEKNVYEMYYKYQEKISAIVNHRILAMNRAEKEKILRVKLEIEEEEILINIERDFINKYGSINEELRDAIKDAYKRLIFPSVEREIRNNLTERAEDDAIEVFSVNLEPLLMQAPIRDARVLALDPGFRTGCKLAAIDEFGNLLDYGVIYPTKPREEIKKSQDIMIDLIEKYKLNLISIGNGTASRETEQVVADMLSKIDREVAYTIVNEAGASIYSASKIGQEEFPDLDVTIRGAISIGRRLQDPLAELVKNDPKHIGVGQYQHDLNQTKLDDALSKVVEDCVNRVGVDINTASVSLLQYVSGLSKRNAKNIVMHRDENGSFKTRKEIKKVKGIGPKTFIQAAGFLRIVDGENILDRTGVHPESYDVAKIILDKDLLNEEIEAIHEEVQKEIEVGYPTLKDIVMELKKPGRDPREAMPKPIFKTDIIGIDDLKEGMIMKGTIRNVIDFGAFVDIGVKEDGLIHISQLSNKFVKNPNDIVSVGDIVEVKILEIDSKKGRIALSMKDL